MAKELTGFQKNLILYRKAADLTQKELAEKLNVSPTTLAGYENAGKEPKISTLIKIADFFGVSTDDLIREKSTDKVENGKAKQALIKSVLALPPERINLLATLVQVAENAMGTPIEGGGTRTIITVDNVPNKPKGE